MGTLGLKLGPASEERKRKIGFANAGKKNGMHRKGGHSEETKLKMKGRIPWNKGKKGSCPHSEEWKQMMSEKMTGRKMTLSDRKKMSAGQRGERGSNWKGGVSPEHEKLRRGMEFKLWREAVYTRDNWTCQKCKERGGKLHPHHIMNFAEYPELRFAIDNGITLCAKDHILFHKTFGRSNNTKEQINQYIYE